MYLIKIKNTNNYLFITKNGCVTTNKEEARLYNTENQATMSLIFFLRKKIEKSSLGEQQFKIEDFEIKETIIT